MTPQQEVACPGCGLRMPASENASYAGYFNTSAECWSVFTEVLGAEYSNPFIFGKVHQLTVDTYAIQHAGGAHPDKSFLTMMESGPPTMTMSLILWFAYSLVVGVIAAYLAGRALGPGADYMAVFRFAGTVAFVAYSLSLPQNSIWYKRNWSATLKSMFDGLVYGLFTGGIFGWLWPSQ